MQTINSFPICNPMHMYLGISTIELNEAYFWVDLPGIVLQVPHGMQVSSMLGLICSSSFCWGHTIAWDRLKYLVQHNQDWLSINCEIGCSSLTNCLKLITCTYCLLQSWRYHWSKWQDRQKLNFSYAVFIIQLSKKRESESCSQTMQFVCKLNKGSPYPGQRKKNISQGSILCWSIQIRSSQGTCQRGP